MVLFSIKETQCDIYTQYINLHTHMQLDDPPWHNYNKFDSPKIKSVIPRTILESILFFSVWLRCPKLLATWNNKIDRENFPWRNTKNQEKQERIGTWHSAVFIKGEGKYIYPRIALNGQPISAPAAVAITAICNKKKKLRL